MRMFSLSIDFLPFFIACVEFRINQLSNNQGGGMIMSKGLCLSALAILVLAIGVYAGDVQFLGTMPCTEEIPTVANGQRIFKLCDGKTKVLVEVVGAVPGERMPRQKAQQVAGLLWEQYQLMREVKTSQEQGGNLYAHGGTPHTKREMMIWEKELKRIIDEGHKAFHDPDLGTNGISCDMCHPDASNTHAETYPKFQTQLKKVVLLRDMINWCIENPLEGKKLAEDDPRMKAMEAYILLSRKNKSMEAGKH
jgi:thiosulfate dehydrogenase